MAAPRSKEFDDVYFSARDGLGETRHVFLEGNDLPDAWERRDWFVVGETGFGTGLNFLTVWKLFNDTKGVGQRLHFISVEKYPLSAAQIDEALAHWCELDELRAQLVDAYPDDPEGVVNIEFLGVRLTIYFDDVVDGLSRCEAEVDAWFLDGFMPSCNPEMWRDEVFEQVGRLSREGTTFATFTSAGFVRRGLSAVGFDVKRVPGFGWKRHMSIGVFR